MRPISRRSLCGKVALAEERLRTVGRMTTVSQEAQKVVQQGRRRVETGGVPRGTLRISRARTKLADFFSILQKTARPCVEHRTCHPNRVTFSNPSVALADCPAPQSSFRLAFNGRAYWHRASMARPLNHHPATEAGAAPFARWLHKSGSHSNQAADLSKLSTSLTFLVIILSRKSTSRGGQAM